MAADKRYRSVNEGSSTTSNYANITSIKSYQDESCSFEPHYIEMNSIKTSNSSYVEMKPEPMNKNNILNTTTENEVCEIENKETSKKNVLERYKNYFALFFMIFIVALLVGCLIFIVKLNNDVRNEKQLQEDLMNATKTEKDEINEKYDQLLMEFINQQNYSNENLKKLNNTLNTQELDHVTSDINQLNQTRINQSLTIYQLQQQLDEFNVSMQELKSDLNNSLKSINQDFYRGYKQLEDGWIALFNGFQYKKTIQAASWYDSRRICQSWNADLAVYGVQDFGSRLLLYRALSTRKSVWVGITDEAKEGTWMWVNGKIAVNSSLFWGRNQPDDYKSNEDCAHLRKNDHVGYLALNDVACNDRNSIGVCEKPI